MSAVHRYEVHGRFNGQSRIMLVHWEPTQEAAQKAIARLSSEWSALRVVLLMTDNRRITQ